MPIDAYSICPCGTGKKIKFCCPDLLGELQKISRMWEGEQGLACLNHVERLLGQHPDRASLLAIRAMLLRALGRWEEAHANAVAFAERHPHNPTALAESAMATAAQEGGRPALDVLQEALALADRAVAEVVYEAIGTVARVLLSEGHWLAGRALLQLQTQIDRQDEQPMEMLVELNRRASVPLLLKEDPFIQACPDDAPWKERFQAALAPAGAGNWRAAADNLAPLAGEVPDSATIWRTLATLRGRLADNPGCAEALRRYAATAIPPEDAVEAEATAMLLEATPLDDPLEILATTWTIPDVELFQAALTLESRAVEMSLDPAATGGDDGPPPRAAYLILDRPLADGPEDLTPETLSRVLGEALLYGRQTDREARVMVTGAAGEDRRQIQTLFEEVAGDAFNTAPVEEMVIARTSASRQLLAHNWHPPKGTTADQLEALATADLRDAVMNRWPKLRLGIFDGKPACEVAGDESCRLKLSAVVMVLEAWLEPEPGEFDFNELRSQLGLPTLEPIDPSEVELEHLPLVRLSRVTAEKASDEALQIGYRRAAAYGAAAALESFARAIVDRPGLAKSAVRFHCYRTLAEVEKDPEKVLQYIEQGRQAAESAGASSASWDLMELTLRFARREAEHLRRLVGHIQQDHIEEPGVAEALTGFLVRVGVIRPDGTVAGPAAEEAPPVAAAAQPEPPSRKLWTPDSQEPGGEKRIWTPD